MRKETKNPEWQFSAWESGISEGVGIAVLVGESWQKSSC